MDTLRATVFGDPKLYWHSKMLHMNQLENDYSYIYYFVSVSYSLAEFPRIFFVLSNLLSTIAGFYRTFQTTGSIIDYVDVTSKIFLGGVVGHWRGESQRLEIKISGI